MPPKAVNQRQEKTKKSKEKVQKRKQEQQQLTASVALVATANQQVDPLSNLRAFHLFNRNDLKIQLECKRISQYESKLRDWFFDLTKHNMKSLYEQGEWGWDDDSKRSEMMEDAAWYIVGKEENGTPVGFSHFRFDMDHGDAVLYCYEIQLESGVRNRGLGRFLLQVLELMAFKANMCKVILTALKSNTRAINFFHKNGYALDETSPEDDIFDVFHYEILSKPNKILQEKSQMKV